jgi:hypothetical protein
MSRDHVLTWGYMNTTRATSFRNEKLKDEMVQGPCAHLGLQEHNQTEQLRNEKLKDEMVQCLKT